MTMDPREPPWPDDSPAAAHAPRHAPRRLLVPIWLFLAAVLAGLAIGAVGILLGMS